MCISTRQKGVVDYIYTIAHAHLDVPTHHTRVYGRSSRYNDFCLLNVYVQQSDVCLRDQVIRLTDALLCMYTNR